MYLKTLTRLMKKFIDAAEALAPSSPSTYHALDAGPLYVCRLEERRVLAADVFDGSAGAGDASAVDGDISTLAQPAITVPGSQSTTEGAALLFSPSGGRQILIVAPGLGAGSLRVDISALESLGQVTPILSFGTTAGLTVTGNGANIFQLQGSLSSINAALASLTFYSPDNGNFTIDLLATDPTTGENDGASIDVFASNVAPQMSFQTNNEFPDEGSVVANSIVLSDPGALDSPQVSWTVSHRGVAIASGAGPEVQFLAAADGDYELTVTAVDKDGGMTNVMQFISVQNVAPTFEMSGVMQSGVVDLTVVIDDPGRELFFVEIYWTNGATTAETIVTSERVLSFSHHYTPEELAQAGELTIAVRVADNQAFERQTLQFREGEPVAAERTEFSARPQEAPPEQNIAVRPQERGATSQIVSADLGRSVTHAAQSAPALHLFVLRVVGPDGVESESYPLPGEALADLPNFLASQGVPDGHYRVYLITGELERLVVDGHLRAGRLVDPTDEIQSGFESPTVAVAAHAAAPPRDGVVSESAELASLAIASRSMTAVSEPEKESSPAADADVPVPNQIAVPTPADSADLSALTSGQQTDEYGFNLALPAIGGAIVVCAASTILHTTVSRQSATDPAPQFCKRARLARKLADRRPATARN
jgi:hypothetical protein